ncbi:hypothetical protein J2Z37_005056 [Ammoniphilus resinae]|uniref:Uncharacterized protein n=1 Tax=Ammoniphilus resinae TaxID=861532 RepID=A0ABS4GXR2_9BACL|nr:hypothetical protein [Ammoniphilus resinae]
MIIRVGLWNRIPKHIRYRWLVALYYEQHGRK